MWKREKRFLGIFQPILNTLKTKVEKIINEQLSSTTCSDGIKEYPQTLLPSEMLNSNLVFTFHCFTFSICFEYAQDSPIIYNPQDDSSKANLV